MALAKPASVEANEYMSAKWDEIVADRKFSEADSPILTLLVQWYAIVQRCMDDIASINGAIVYTNAMKDIKAMPQIAVLKQASAEIRQLNKQLGIADDVESRSEEESADVSSNDNVLDFLIHKHNNEERRAISEGQS